MASPPRMAPKAMARSHGGQGFRLGGDEFALILPERALEEARRALGAFPVSLGVVRAEEGQGQALLELADRRMYRTKRQKRAKTPWPAPGGRKGGGVP